MPAGLAGPTGPGIELPQAEVGGGKIGIDIQGRTRDITIRGTRLENTAGGHQRTGIRIGREAQRVILEDNTFDGCPTRIEDLRAGTSASQ